MNHMKKQINILLGLLLLGTTVYGEELAIESVLDIPYGRNVTQSGVEEDLLMDIYYPKEGDQKRPLVILAHGGYFLFGDKESFATECKELAAEGFVAVSINYRLIDVENTDEVSKIAVIDAVNDMKAAVRYFYKSAQEQNPYLVDTNNIVIGGYSAGAITALHYAYANTAKDAFEMGGELFLSYLEENGGIEGNSGNAGYSTKVKGVVNIAGSLFSASFVDANEPPLFSVHGNADDIVPFESGTTGDTGVMTEGSKLIHQRANAVGLQNRLIEVEGGDHSAFYFCNNCRDELKSFIRSVLE